MADNSEDNLDKTEEPTPEKREDFREKGQVAVSREVTSVFSLASTIGFLTFFGNGIFIEIQKIMKILFQNSANYTITSKSFLAYVQTLWIDWLLLILPIFILGAGVSSFLTFFQTRFNWSWKKLTPDFKRLNALKGIKRLANTQALMELLKGCGKMLVIGGIGYLIIMSEIQNFPGLLNVSIELGWMYWAEITKILFWSVASLMLIIAGLDYTYNFVSLENQMKMTKQEVKEESKKREVDPQIRARIRRIQREMAMAKTMKATKEATVIITNPDHYAIAMKYEIGMPAPLVLAKGIDSIALKMKEIAKNIDIPIVENKPLARTLYKIVEVGQEIPHSLYLAVSEVIKYVYWLKGTPTQPNSNGET